MKHGYKLVILGILLLGLAGLLVFKVSSDKAPEPISQEQETQTESTDERGSKTEAQLEAENEARYEQMMKELEADIAEIEQQEQQSQQEVKQNTPPKQEQGSSSVNTESENNVEGAFDFGAAGFDDENYYVDPEDTNDGVHFH